MDLSAEMIRRANDYISGRCDLHDLAAWTNDHLPDLAELADEDRGGEVWGFTQVRIYQHDDGILDEDTIRQELADYLREQHLTSEITRASG